MFAPKETIDSLRHHLPEKGIEDIMVDGGSWKRVELEAKHAEPPRHPPLLATFVSLRNNGQDFKGQ